MHVTSEHPKPSANAPIDGASRYAAPAIIAVLAAGAELFGEGGRLMLRYDHDELAVGEYWRLISGHLVHLGPSHMAMNVLALAVLTLIFRQTLRARDWLAAGLVSAVAIDVGLYWLSPTVAWYVGLSGVLHGFWAAACVRALTRGERREALVLTALLLVKLGYETVIGPVPLTGTVAAGPVVEVAHAYGAAGGAISALALRAVEACRRRL